MPPPSVAWYSSLPQALNLAHKHQLVAVEHAHATEAPCACMSHPVGAACHIHHAHSAPCLPRPGRVAPMVNVPLPAMSLIFLVCRRSLSSRESWLASGPAWPRQRRLGTLTTQPCRQGMPGTCSMILFMWPHVLSKGAIQGLFMWPHVLGWPLNGSSSPFHVSSPAWHPAMPTGTPPTIPSQYYPRCPCDAHACHPQRPLQCPLLLASMLPLLQELRGQVFQDQEDEVLYADSSVCPVQAAAVTAASGACMAGSDSTIRT